MYVVFTLFSVCVAWGRCSARWTCRKKKIILQRLLDQNQAGPYMWEKATYPPILGVLGLFTYPTLRG